MIAAVVQVSKLVWKLKTLRLSHSPTPSYGSPWVGHVVAESSLVSSLRVAMSPLGVSFTDGDVVFYLEHSPLSLSAEVNLPSPGSCPLFLTTSPRG